MPKAKSDQAGLSWIEEVTFGVTPSGNLQRLRKTGETLAEETRTERSAEIRSDRQPGQSLRVGKNGGGGIPFELSYAAYDDFFAMLLMATAWSAGETITGGTFSVTGATGTITHDAAGAGFASAVAGEWIKTSGFSTAANNGIFKILSVTDSSNIVVAGAAAMADDSGDSATIKRGQQITNGVDHRSISIEREYTDLTNTFAAFRGFMFDQVNLNLPLEGKAAGNWSCLGKEETSETATIGTGYTAASTNRIISTAENSSVVVLEGTPAVNQANNIGEMMEFAFTYANSLRPRPVLGTLGPSDLAGGTINLTGTLKTYFETATLYNKYLARTETALAVILTDPDGNVYIFDFPAVQLSAGRREGGALNTDVVADFTWDGERHTTEDVTMRMVRFAA